MKILEFATVHNINENNDMEDNYAEHGDGVFSMDM